MIGFDSTAERRGFWRGVLCGLAASGMVAMCMAPPAARAQDLGQAFATVTGADGAVITLHLGRGVCVGEALAAVWLSPDRQTTVPGCWVLFEGRVVLVSFLDGERGNIPVDRLVKVRAG